MSDDIQSKIKRILIETLRENELDKLAERECNRGLSEPYPDLPGSKINRNPESGANRSGFLGDSDAALIDLNLQLPREYPAVKRVGGMIVDNNIEIDPDDKDRESRIESIDSSSEDRNLSRELNLENLDNSDNKNKVIDISEAKASLLKKIASQKEKDKELTRKNNEFDLTSNKVFSAKIKDILLNNDEWSGVIAFDRYVGETVKKKDVPWTKDVGTTYSNDWTSTDTTLLACWIAEKYHIGIADSVLDNIINAVAQFNVFNSLQEELSSFEWDGTPRIETWLKDYLDATEDPEDYLKEIGKRFLMAACARAFHPGCKADNVLILEGQTGSRKSQAIEALCGEKHYCDSPIDLNNVFAPAQLLSCWFYELGELTLFKAYSNERQKAFLSQKVDHYSPKNIRRKIRQPRGIIFLGTTNGSKYLSDSTGNRRPWPVKTGKINLDLIKRDRGQLFAEAIYLCDGFKALKSETETPENRWWLSDEDEAIAKIEQDRRYEEDPWEEIISVWFSKNSNKINAKGYVTVAEVLNKALDIESKYIKKDQEMKVSKILIDRFGWKKGNLKRTENGRIYPYYPPNEEE